MLKTIVTLGTGIALGCYYKSHKVKNKLSDEKKDKDLNLSEKDKPKKILSKLLK
ncbi:MULTISPECIES: hypothetical protein [Acinetobacter]|jgi:uncharacterized lipoprotein YehR (DUF1307 family)|uniref:hypothetical protein n=1 Tax=Acinetobacter TaxID=469 RepID=UPI000A45742A|nr:hypothetical protein [Acinetobacter sp. AG1]